MYAIARICRELADAYDYQQTVLNNRSAMSAIQYFAAVREYDQKEERIAELYSQLKSAIAARENDQ